VIHGVCVNVVSRDCSRRVDGIRGIEGACGARGIEGGERELTVGGPHEAVILAVQKIGSRDRPRVVDAGREDACCGEATSQDAPWDRRG
jgi:hypothetical protein